VVCNSGVGLTPSSSGQALNLSAGGLYNGLVLLVDDETGSYWDHITGQALHGPLAGASMAQWGVEVSTAGAALEREPDLPLLRSKPGLLGNIMGRAASTRMGKGWFPPGFRGTMEPVDPRLPEMCMGLGVVAGVPRFYSLEQIKEAGELEDQLQGRAVRIRVDPASKVPVAAFLDDGSRPLQLFTRWYGFSATYPGCEVWGEPVTP